MFKNLFIADLKMLSRNRQALFWTFMFPFMFALIFGLFFGENSNNGSLAIVNGSSTEIAENYVQALKDSGLFKIVEDKTIEQAKDGISNSSLIGAVEIPKDFGSIPNTALPNTPIQTISEQKILLIVDPGNAAQNAVLTGFTDKFMSNLNLKTQNAQEIFTYEQEKTNNRKLTYFDFILMGLLGLAVMQSSVIGLSVAMAKYREDKILKRITTTPLPTSVFIISEVLSRLVLNLLQILLILIVGLYIFSAHIYGNLFEIIVIALFGALLFQLLGFAVASASKTTDAAQGMATAINIPMMFLAGVFFPIDSLPTWLSKIVQFLPLAPLLRVLRNVGLNDMSPFSNMNDIYILIGWIVVLLFLSIWRFRLTEE